VPQIAPLWIPVPPRTYGGIELMLSWLSRELLKRSHKVTLFASGDSTAGVPTESPIDKALWLRGGVRSPHAAVIKLLHMLKERASSFDIIHNHFNFFMFPLALFERMPPMLSTVHRPIDSLYAEVMKLFPQIRFCVLSEDAKKSAREQGIAVEDVVPNGIDISAYPYSDEPEDYFLYLGRCNQEKGVVAALKAARRAGKKLIVGGNVAGVEEWTYFMHEVQPLLNHPDIRFVGQVDFSRKVKLLRGAQALLFPVERREPFGLVMVEAMACGTPVVAFRQGSVPEIVRHGVNGFVVNTEEEMADAMSRIPAIDRSVCRKSVEERFLLEHMVTGYEKLYRKIIDQTP
jgi:glycosyltransferase involved in cell wall biosynthesis